MSFRVLFVVLFLSSAATQASAEPTGRENMVTHGPMLGRPSSDGVAVWARTRDPGTFTVRYGTTPDLLDQTSDPAVTRLEDDLTGWVRLTGLKPDTRYWYELQMPDTTGRSGRNGSFQTLADEDTYRDEQWNPNGLFNFSFEFACGNNQIPKYGSGPELPTFRTMNREISDEVNFAILNGDWLYETRRNYSAAQWIVEHLGPGEVGQDGVPEILTEAPTIAGVWENYKWFLESAPPLSEWHANVPSLFTFDDHEILNDVWGAGEAGLRDRRAVFRDIAVRAWYDYLAWANPNDELPAHFGTGAADSVIPGAGALEYLVDSNADFTRMQFDEMTNLHVHWDTPDAGVNDNDLDAGEEAERGHPNAGVYDIVGVAGPTRLKVFPPFKARTPDRPLRYSIGRKSYFRKTVGNVDFFVLDTRGMRELHDTKRPDMPGLSMLGDEQRNWLIEGCRNSDADFIFVVSSVNFMIPHVGGEAIKGGDKDEAWTVFLEEREMLIDFWDGLDARVFVLTGDLHNSYAAQITDNVLELASGPHNSNNHHAGDEGDRPANGRFQWGPRPVDILWSTWFPPDIERKDLKHVTYCVVRVNNVFDAPQTYGQNNVADSVRKIAFPKPQVLITYYDGRTGRMRWTHSVMAKE